jgi:hypothetical protein
MTMMSIRGQKMTSTLGLKKLVIYFITFINRNALIDFYIKHLNLYNQGDHSQRVGFPQYSDNFLRHNINGKRLLLMNKDDLRNIGITSEGYIIDLYVIIV